MKLRKPDDNSDVKMYAILAVYAILCAIAACFCITSIYFMPAAAAISMAKFVVGSISIVGILIILWVIFCN